jgi:hypothetical protein
MQSGDQLPKAWTYVTIVIAVIVVGGLTGRSTSFVKGVAALLAVLAIAFVARLLYHWTHK